ELRAAEPLDEVAAAAQAECLERAQLTVDGAVAARDALGAHAVAGDDPLPFEQELRERAPVGLSFEQPVGERPAALRRCDRGGARPREASRPPLRLRRAVAPAGAQRLPRVVRHLARPDELPQSGEDLAALQLSRVEQVVPEERLAPEHGTDRLASFTLAARGAGGRAEKRGI